MYITQDVFDQLVYREKLAKRLTKACFFASGERQIQSESLIESITFVVALFTPDLGTKLTPENFEYWCRELVLDNVNPARLLLKRGV